MMRTACVSLVALLVAACGTNGPGKEPPAPVAREASRAWLVERNEGQGEAAVRAAAERIGLDVLAVAPLFPDVSPADDPAGLSRITIVRAAGATSDAQAWDTAYRLRDAGGFAAVEPDLDSTLTDAMRRQASTACLGDGGVPAPGDSTWSLREMHVDAARTLVPPAGGKQLGEGVRICHPDSGYTDHVDLDLARYDLASDVDLVDGDEDARDPLGYSGNPGHGSATGSVLVSSGDILAGTGSGPPGKVSGLAPRATIVPIRALKSVVQVFDSDIARAVRHAVDARCDVVSMSLGGRFFFGLERAIEDAVRRGVIVVAASGNCVGFVVAPAAYDRTIAVAASNAAHAPWRGSSRGGAIDITAPGEDVWVARASIAPGPHVEATPGDGTSFATAAVAGAAADWIAFHGRDAIAAAQHGATRRDLFASALRASVTTPAGWDAAKFGPGILDVEKLLRFDIANAPTQLAPPPRDDVVSLIARMLDVDRATVRAGVARLLGEPADLDAELDRYGAELMDLAARDPASFAATLTRPPDALAPAREALRANASATLAARLARPR